MLQEEPAPGVVLLADSAVHEVHVDGRQDVAATGQEFAQVVISGVREVTHVVVPVHHENEREGAGSVRVPDAPVERELLRSESPVSVPGLRLVPEVDELGRVHGLGGERNPSPVLRAVLVIAVPVGEGAYRELTTRRGARARHELPRQDREVVTLLELHRTPATGDHEDQQAPDDEATVVRNVHGVFLWSRIGEARELGKGAPPGDSRTAPVGAASGRLLAPIGQCMGCWPRSDPGVHPCPILSLA